MNTLSYKDLVAHVQYDDVLGRFSGQVRGASRPVHFHSSSARGLREAFQVAVDDHLEACRRQGVPGRRRYSGRLRIRMAPEVFSKALRAATSADVDLATWIETVLRRATVQL